MELSEKSSQLIAKIIQSRRTTKDFDGREVSDEILKQLLEAANWAPNHKLNQPWRFRILKNAIVTRWLQDFSSLLTEEEKKAFAGPMERVKKVGALIFVHSVRDPNELTDLENYAAVCAGIQNILLLSTAMGLGSYWSTAKIFSDSRTQSWLQVSDSERFVGAIWLGYSKNPEPKPRKPVSEFSIWK